MFLGPFRGHVFLRTRSPFTGHYITFKAYMSSGSFLVSHLGLQLHEVQDICSVWSEKRRFSLDDSIFAPYGCGVAVLQGDVLCVGYPRSLEHPRDPGQSMQSLLYACRCGLFCTIVDAVFIVIGSGNLINPSILRMIAFIDDSSQSYHND